MFGKTHTHTLSQPAKTQLVCKLCPNEIEDEESKSIRFNYVAHAKTNFSMRAESHTRPIKLNKQMFPKLPNGRSEKERLKMCKCALAKCKSDDNNTVGTRKCAYVCWAFNK